MTDFADELTLVEARDLLRTLLDDGHACPVCTQFAKVYKRKLNARMAWTAVRLYRAGAAERFVHLSSLAGDGCEGGKLRYWGLVEEETARREDGGRSGWWTLTPKGVAFVQREVRVPSHARIYDGRCLGLVGEPIGIGEALGEKFDYAELMAA
jgi:hypothetical protein